MSRCRRIAYHTDGIYHVFNRGNRKNDIFSWNSDRNFYEKKLIYLTKVCGIELISYCLMDNHYHLALKQGEGEKISKLMQRLGTSYSKFFNTKYQLVGHTFQGRYGARHVRTQRDLSGVLRYIRNNPVRAGYVYNPEHYRWYYINQFYEKYLGTDLAGVRL